MPLDICGGQFLRFKLLLRRSHMLKMEDVISVTWQFKSSGRTIKPSPMLVRENAIPETTKMFFLFSSYLNFPSSAAARSVTALSGQMFRRFCTATVNIRFSRWRGASQSCHWEKGPRLKKVFLSKEVGNPPGQKVGSERKLEMWLKAEPGRGSTQRVPHPTTSILQRLLGRYLAFC